MTRKSYQRQHLALWAAGFINAAGTTAIAFGAEMTRVAVGHYGLLLTNNNDLADIPETFSLVQAKQSTEARWAVVNDDTAPFKSIRVFNESVAADADIEIKVFRSVLPNL